MRRATSRSVSRTGTWLALLTLVGLVSTSSGNEVNQPRTDLSFASGAFPKLETRFTLEVKGNPWNFAENDVQVAFRYLDGQTVRLPAFFDGGMSWKARFTPPQPGRYTITAITLNGDEVRVTPQPAEFDVTGKGESGFVRIDPRHKQRFILDDGTPYYPLGHDVAWDHDVPALIRKLGNAGENWSRIWMCHWGETNLDWLDGRPIKAGTYDLDVARRWDAIVSACEQAGVHFQLVLQHHGQFSTRVNPNWQDMPWNTRNGGWLQSAELFFTDERAIAATKARYRYILARWGHSPSIMAWELFNEVQNTDAWLQNKHADVARWHATMASFLRAHDLYRHLITTSWLPTEKALTEPLDYLQEHQYAPDPIITSQSLDQIKLVKPYFVGEFGPPVDRANDSAFLRRGLWASLMSQAAGAAQYWFWERVDQYGWYPVLGSAAHFAQQSGLAKYNDLRPIGLTVETKTRGPLSFGPGVGWKAASKTTFTIEPDGAVNDLGKMVGYLHGEYHRTEDSEVRLRVHFLEPGTCTLKLGTVAAAGAQVSLAVDGKVQAERAFPPASKDRPTDASLSVQVPAGRHELWLRNGGKDWIMLDEFTLDPYSPALRAIGKGNGRFLLAWIHPSSASHHASAAKAVLTASGLEPGNYTVHWWDTERGEALSPETATVKSQGRLQLAIPSSGEEFGLWVEPAHRSN